MFGEEKFFGKSEHIIDDKTRLSLPTSTKRETGEKILIIKDNDLDIFKLYNVEEISKLFDKINEKILNAKTKEEAIINKKKILELSEKIIRSSKVDTLGRIVLGKNFKGTEKVELIGANNHLILRIKK